VPPHRPAAATFGALAVYAGIAVAAYLPVLPLSGARTQICTCGDTAQEVWFLAWVPFALAHGHSLFYSNWVLYPSGVNLTDNTSMPLLGLLAAPVTLLAGPVAAYNLVLRAGFALSGFAMFAVLRQLVRRWPAAFAGGLLYGFSPFMTGQGLSHAFLVFAPVPPLVLGVLLRVFGGPPVPPRRAGLLLGVLFAAQFFIAAETFAMLALFTVLGVLAALGYRCARDRLPHLLGTAAWAVPVCAVLIGYPVYFFLAGPRHIAGPPHPLRGLDAWHSDLLSAVLPTRLMRFAPAGLPRVGAVSNLQENGTYLGLPLALAAVFLGIMGRRRPVTAICGMLAVLSYALSLGPRVFVLNRDTGLPGPFTLLLHVPVLQAIEPARFSLFTALFTAVVLATGLDMLCRGTASARAGAAEGPGRRVRGFARPAAVAALGAAALAPLLPRWPYPAGRPVIPAFFTSAAVHRIPAGAVVATFPFPAKRFNQALAWQAVSGMRFRLLGGTTFFVPGRDGRAVELFRPPLRPPGIAAVFDRALFGTGYRLRGDLIDAIGASLRAYRVSAVIVDPRVGRDPALAVRYLIAVTGRLPERTGGVLGWFDLRGGWFPPKRLVRAGRRDHPVASLK
jgi:hypothetical protein